MTRRAWTGLCLLGIALGGCGLKGPLYLPEKSEVKIRPGPAGAAPEQPPEGAAPQQPAEGATTQQPAAPEQPKTPEQPPQPAPPGQDRG
jgi:predicted small lipoprotein YifL